MQQATPPGASNQQQALLKVMPIVFGVFGIFFPAGLVLYWTTSNGWQIGQQYFMLKSRPTAEQLAQNAKSKPRKAEKKGFMSSMMERAEQQRQARGGTTPKPGSKKPGNPKPPTPKGQAGGSTGSGPGEPGSNPKQQPGSGGNGRGGDPKKRPKR
jgi:YidC/Oxa1 family membrane protein insertase